MADVRYRPLAESELIAAHELALECDRFDGYPWVVDLGELKERLRACNTDLATDSLAAFVDERLVAYVISCHSQADAPEETTKFSTRYSPDHRNDDVPDTLMRWAVGRATEQLLASGKDRPAYVSAAALEHDHWNRDLYERHGLRPVRWFESLLRPLTVVPEPVEVSGLRIVPWPDERDEDLRSMINTAFEDHWGHSPLSKAEWQYQVHGPHGRPDLSFIALDSADRAVAASVNSHYPEDEALLGRAEAWIGTLGTLREWRGRGVATALISHSLRAFAAAGMSHARIGVDSENPSGAARLYRNLGFERIECSVVHQLRVR